MNERMQFNTFLWNNYRESSSGKNLVEFFSALTFQDYFFPFNITSSEYRVPVSEKTHYPSLPTMNSYTMTRAGFWYKVLAHDNFFARYQRVPYTPFYAGITQYLFV